jgi:hypothetical protein
VQWFDDGKLASVEVSLRRSGCLIFGNIPMSDVARAFDFDDPSEAEGCSWFRVSRDDDTILAWMPEGDRFEELIADGTLPGGIEDGDPFVGPLNAEQLEIITSGSRGVLMEWDEPGVLRRIADEP